MPGELGFSKGLAGVVADSTSVSQVQGEVGKLIYRGISIEDLAYQSNFEECVYFSLYGKLPTQAQYETFVQEMKKHRKLPQHVEGIISSAPKTAHKTAHPMAVLQAAIAAFAYEESPVDLKNETDNIHEAIRIISGLATAVAHIARSREGKSLIEPKQELTHAENFLYMLQGKEASKEEAHIFDVALMLHLDHDFNASTFTGRVIASTEAKLALSISGAIGALSGPLHGGANEKVLEMADKIGSPEKAKDWILNAIATKAKVMGFGHRVYRTMDPRAKVLRGMLEDFISKKTASDRKTYDILRIVHDTMIEELGKKEKDYIWPNVDFWSGSLYRLMGIQSIDFTPIFAVARVAGWSSHIIEMWRDNRIYRPAAKYVGPDHVEYVPMKSR